MAVVIPHYNRADLLRLTIDSVLQQSAACQVIVVDDGSDTDQW
ncbi:MAG TPA: glycosyltransferase family 2 protein, partial [Planctomycetaceae bacterium]|nr:glycosyltransferase family 2 protein [Planctomycetaceae bacterium]